MAWDIVGRRFAPDEFDAYLAGLNLRAWHPEFVVLHNTAIPSLAQRPQGLTPDHIHNLHGFYLGKGWSGCPHLFVDQNGIWVLNPLTRPGVHSPSWNALSWGVEMLGEYGTEHFHTGAGARVRDHSTQALAALCRAGGFPASAIRFHREDPKTTHRSCPGDSVSKEWVVATVANLMARPKEPAAKLVLYRHGMGDEPAAVLALDLRDGRAYLAAPLLAQATGLAIAGSDMVAVREALQDHYTLRWLPTARRLYAVEK